MIRICYPPANYQGMITPDQLFDYLGLTQEERPDTPRVAVVPISCLDKDKQYFTQCRNERIPFHPKWLVNGNTIINPAFGKYEHYVQVTLSGSDEIETVDYDFYHITGGGLDENGVGIPGVVVFPVFYVPGELEPYVGFFLQWRPVIRNLDTGKHGCWVATTPGGFGKLTKLSMESAREEAKEEFGVDLTNLREIGYASENRAITETPIRYWLAEFMQTSNSPDDSHETIFGKFAVPFRQFPLGVDGIINTAYAFASSALRMK